MEGLTTKIHTVCTSDRFAVGFSLSPDNHYDVLEVRILMSDLHFCGVKYILMDRTYQDDITRNLVFKLGLIPVVLPKSNRKSPWSYDTLLCRQRNLIERFSICIKRFRRIFTRYYKLDIIFSFFLNLAIIFDLLFM